MANKGYRKLTFLVDNNGWQRSLSALSPNSLTLSDHAPEAHAKLSRYRDYLGHEFTQVVIDCRDQLHVDAIAALAGTLVAGGELFLVGEPKQSVMWHRLKDAWPAAINSQAPDLPQLPTTEQTELISKLQDFAQVHVLTASRGRGKSHVLGEAVAQRQQQQPNQRIVVTAPRRANARVLLEAAPQAQFVAWDKLLASKKDDALLVIDEAAGLPLWAIQQLCQLYTPWLMATTVDGYEGCGRGFAVHFADWVEGHFKYVQQHTLTTPLRWPSMDPLENWLQRALLLTTAPDKSTDRDGIVSCHASELDEAQLHQAFELLLEAHYQSSPNDLALLLDDPQQFLTLKYQRGRLVGVCWNAIEGPIADALQKPVLQGKRRPKGNLLPQAIGYFLQQPWALQLTWCRIVRIAVLPSQRRQQHASALVTHTKHWARRRQCQALGTSFGYTQQLADFWEKNALLPIRTSTKIDRVSARHQHIRACWLTSLPPSEWLELLEYGHAELNWVLHQHHRLSPSHPVSRRIRSAVHAGYLPSNAASFALNDC